MYLRHRVLPCSIWVFTNSLAILEDLIATTLEKRERKCSREI
jgi:hypothetical protein